MTKTEIEYEEAPSGSVTFYNYKEPLMRFDNGFGYVGALVFDTKTDKIQCHFCGGWYGALTNHIGKEHNMTASQYKDGVGLLQTTALVSESARAKMIANGLDKRLSNLRRGIKKTQATKDKTRATMLANGLKAEFKNLKGTCPAQLIDRMQKIYKEKGNKIVMKDFSSGMNVLLIKNFGSLKNACARAGIPYNKNGQSKKKFHMLIEDSKEDLIKYLKDFEKINGRKPSQSDCKRGLLPLKDKYVFNFGTWKRALLEAFN